MSPSHGAEVELHFRTAEEGGRVGAVSLGHGTYRPHFVVSGGEYMGVAVTEGPFEPVQPGGNAIVTVVFVYEPAVNYSALVHGVLFEVMEGARVVASGRVLRLVHV
jgi:translation elongation factor EF-Tu-like GTPase